VSIDYAKEYGKIHQLEKRFPGYSLGAYVKPIAKLVEEHGTKTILDWGCGKAKGYEERAYHEAWGGIMPTLYDIGIPKFARKPKGKFDGVIASDVMEHIAESDVDNVLQELFGFVEYGGWLFLGISCRPANKKFKGGALHGENLHLTIKPPSWWIEKITTHKSFTTNFRIVANWDVDGYFDEPDTPWESISEFELAAPTDSAA